MSKNIFITATGTDVGKTYISGLIIKKMCESGFKCGYYKPVLSGVSLENDKLAESDCNYVIHRANLKADPNSCVSYYWQEAVSPHLASLRSNEKIDRLKLKKDFLEKSNSNDYLLIEGAGGITCPLILDKNDTYLLSDLIKDFELSILIIADAGLGTINSTLLTVEYAKSRGINIQGIILNNFDPQSFVHKDNLIQIERLTGVKVVASVQKNQMDIELLEHLFV